MPQKPTLVRIRIYPVKSLGGFDRDVWELDAFGLRYDRRWMIVDPDGRFMTQRDYPGMAEIAVEMQADRLILSVPMLSPVAVPLEPEPGASEPVTIWGDTVAARAASEDANRWLGEVLKTPCRLVYMPEESARSVDRAHVGRNAQLAFADGYPLLLTSVESLAELNRRLSEPVTMERFRPNLVVRGLDGPHVEDTWRRIRVSDMELQVVKPCSRCVIVTTDQQTGERGPEPLKTLAKYRTSDGEVYFGQNVVHLGHGRIRVGDDVQVLETGEPVPDISVKAGSKTEQADRSAKKGKEHKTGPRMWPTEPGFELYIPEEEELEMEPALDETEADEDLEPAPAAGTPVEDIVFPFEVDLVVTPEDLKEAARQEEEAQQAEGEEEQEAVEEEEPAAEAEEVPEEEESEEVEEEAAEELDEEAAFLEEVLAEAAAQEAAAKKGTKKGTKKGSGKKAAAEEEIEEEEPEEAAEEEEEEEAEEEVASRASKKKSARGKKSGRGKVIAIEFVLGERPDASDLEALYEAAGRPEATGDQDPGRMDRVFDASNVVVAAWFGDNLAGVLRGWSDGARDGFISDLVVHPDHVGAGISVDLVRRAMDAHPGVRWVLRATATSPYIGSALGWIHLGGGWFVSRG